MGVYDNLDKFSLAFHGDGREQQWAKHVLPEFPAYEEFWQKYIVPLTNRVDPKVSRSQNPQSWIDIRTGVRSVHEQMGMHHYSIFYYLARATQRIRSGNSEFSEDIFSLLDACGDNVHAFFKSIRSILKDFGKGVDFLSVHKNEYCSDEDCLKEPNLRGAFVEVQAYRDTILHNPVLSHVVSQSGLWMPRAAFLDDVKLSWRNAARLKPEEWINSRELYTRLHLEVTSFLQVKWKRIIEALHDLRDSDKFKRQWALDGRLLPIAAPEETRSTSQPLIVSVASWSPNISYSPTTTSSPVLLPSPLEKPKI